MNGKFRKTKLYILLLPLILGIGLLGCGPMVAGADNIEPTGVPIVVGTSGSDTTAEPTESTNPMTQDKQDIRAALAVHLRIDAGELTVIVKENTGAHARGGVDNGYFLAAKVNGSWVIVNSGQGSIDCDAIMQYSIPNSMVPECPDSILDEAAIRSALAAHLGVDPNALSVAIKENTGTHARGKVDNGYFLAAKVNRNWVIAADGQGVIDCNMIAQYAFPTSMVPDCAGSSSADSPIKAALAAHLGVDASTLTVVVEQETSAHARGGVDNGYFLATKVNGNWSIVADGQGVIDCNLVTQYSFPASIVPECTISSSIDSPIKVALAAHLGVNVNTLNVVVEQETSAHARGNVDNGYFLAAKVNGNWIIVADGQGAIDCNAIMQYAFPASMVPECAGTSSAASSIKAALATHLSVNVSTLNVVVEQDTGTHVRGNVDNGYFLAAKVNGNWVIVADGQGAIDCIVVSQYGFPTSVVPECGD